MIKQKYFIFVIKDFVLNIDKICNEFDIKIIDWKYSLSNYLSSNKIKLINNEF